MANMKPNTQGIVNYKRQESERKKEAVLEALKELVAEGDQVTKAEICRRAGVSKTFLYGCGEEVLGKIEQGMRDQGNKGRAAGENMRFGDGSKDRVIQSLKRRIERLEEENLKLKRDNAILVGKLVK